MMGYFALWVGLGSASALLYLLGIRRHRDIFILRDAIDVCACVLCGPLGGGMGVVGISLLLPHVPPDLAHSVYSVDRSPLTVREVFGRVGAVAIVSPLLLTLLGANYIHRAFKWLLSMR